MNLNQTAQYPPAFLVAALRHCTRLIQDVRWKGILRPLQLLLQNDRIDSYTDVVNRSQSMLAPNNDYAMSSSDDDNSSFSSSSSSPSEESEESATDGVEQSRVNNRAYYISEQNLADTQYGNIIFGSIVVRDSIQDDWRMTDERVAIKVMRWEAIIRGLNGRRIENPGSECGCMDYIKRRHADYIGEEVPIDEAMSQTKLIMPHDFLYDDLYLYIIMPYIEDDLCNIMANRWATRGENVSENECRFIFRQVLKSIEWLQLTRVCHRDLSLENLMIDNEGRVFLIDFGMALQIPYTEGGNDNNPPHPLRIRPQGRCGKEPYMCPEIYRNVEFDGHKADLWSAGIILLTMLIGGRLWQRPDFLDRYFAAHSRRNLITIETFPTLSRDAVDLLKRMLALDERERLTLEQINDHTWMRGVFQNPML